jgi:ADP-ribose diphosphatase
MVTKSSRKPSSQPKTRVLSSREVYKGPLFRVTRDEVIEPTGIRVRRDIVRHGGSVVILAVEESQTEPRVLLERQYRHAVQDYLWELPAGRIDSGEEELPAAKRELREETGYTAQHWKRVLKFYASPGFVAEPMALFLAQGLRPGASEPEADEVIEKRLVRLSKAVRMATAGTIRDSKTIAGVLWLDHDRRTRKARK